MTATGSEEEIHTGIATLAEFNRYLGSPSWTERQKLNAALALQGTQNELELWLNRPVEPVQIRESARVGPDGIINLKITPILKVIKVESTNPSLAGAYSSGLGYQPFPEVMERSALVGPNGRLLDYLYPVVGDPQIVPGGVYIGAGNFSIFPMQDFYAIEYVAGYNGYVNNGLKIAIMRVAAREVQHNHDDTLNLRGGEAQQASNADSREKGWTEDELIRFDRLRRRVIA